MPANPLPDDDLQQDLDELGVSLRRACESSEHAVQGWLEGRVEPTAENREAFADMLSSAQSACAIMPQFRDALGPELCDRFLRVRETLELIAEHQLAQDKIDEVADALERYIRKQEKEGRPG